MNYNKITGFHTSTTSNVDGIGAWLSDIAVNGIPLVGKCVDGTTTLMDIQNLMNAGYQGEIVYRKMTGFPNQYDDVPFYGTDIETEADRYWNTVLAEFPPELDKNKVWIELINEPDRNYADWLGELGYAIGLRAIRDGYKVLLFGWYTGGPEMSDWETTGMMKFLGLCAENPDRVGVSLHEYSLDKTNLFANSPYLVGRFQFLHEVCDNAGINRPTIFITEFGYQDRDFPEKDQAIQEFIQAGAIYAEYPNIKGVVIWALDKGWADIDKKVHKLTEGDEYKMAILENVYPEPTPPPEPTPDETFNEFLIRIAEENRSITYNNIAALQLAITEDSKGFVPYGDEAWAEFDGVNYAIQGARLLHEEPPIRRVYYCIVGEWDNIKYIDQNEISPPPPDDGIIIELPNYFSQRDARWADIPIGEPTGHTKTIGNWGCLLTSYNMMANYLELCQDTPDQFNTRAVNAGAMSGPNINAGALRTIFPDQVEYDGYWEESEYLNNKVREWIDAGIPVPIRVDFHPETPQEDQHWVLVIGYTTDDFQIANPWTGNIENLSEVYGIAGNDILEGLFYHLKEPDVQKIDVGSFMIADPTCMRVVRHTSGSQEDISDIDLGNGYICRRKGNNGEWWYFNSEFAHLIHDTSPAPDSNGVERVYTITQDGGYAPKNPLQMSLGEIWVGGPHWVQFRSKDGCRELSENSGTATNWAQLLAYEENYEFNSYGQRLVFDEVVWVETTNNEIQIYAKKDGKNCGWIGWFSPFGASEIVEIHWDREMPPEPERYCDI